MACTCRRDALRPGAPLDDATGGAIGYGLPVAVGAAVASKRRVLALESDGSMMYTPQALGRMAREGLDVTVVGLVQSQLRHLNFELSRVGAHVDGDASARMLDIDDPTLDLAGVATSLGVPSERATTADELVSALGAPTHTPGPMFIEAVLPKRFGCDYPSASTKKISRRRREVTVNRARPAPFAATGGQLGHLALEGHGVAGDDLTTKAGTLALRQRGQASA